MMIRFKSLRSRILAGFLAVLGVALAGFGSTLFIARDLRTAGADLGGAVAGNRQAHRADQLNGTARLRLAAYLRSGQATDRDAMVETLGRLAEEIGRGDAAVAAALKNQAKVTVEAIARTFDLGAAFDVGAGALANPGAALGDSASRATDAGLVASAIQVQGSIGQIIAMTARAVGGGTAKPLLAFAEEARRLREAAAGIDANPAVTSRMRKLSASLTEALKATVGGAAQYEANLDARATAIKALEAMLSQSSEAAATAAAAAETHFSDALAASEVAASRLHAAMLASAAGVIVLGLALAYLLGGSIVRPILRLKDTIDDLARGDLAVDVSGAERPDELGLIARSVAVLREGAIARVRLEEEQTSEQRARQRRADLVDRLVRDFESRVTQALSVVTTSAGDLDVTAQTMTGSAASTNEQAVMSSAAAEQTSANVQTVASAAEEMVASLREIERQVSRSNEVAGVASREAHATDSAMAGLTEAAKKIGQAVTLINAIAGQTNLLALNATIEAARAGEAGRGFAVVAAEVKELASQTARATDEIGGQIAAIQAASTQACDAIQQIGRTIMSMTEITGAIAGTVTEQTSATNEIARNAAEAARGTQDVSATIAHVLDASHVTGAAARQVLSAAAELSKQSQTVQQDVDAFLNAIRAA